MPSQDKLFLAASVNSSNALTDLFDFVWPTAVALWNLQWQAKGFIAQRPNANVAELNSRFVLGSGIRGANLHRVANDTTWAEMQQWLARLLLSETCALFEGWIEAALDELALPQTIRKGGTRSSLDQKLQFPTTKDATGIPSNGVEFAIDQIQGAVGSRWIQTCFHPTQLKNKKHSQPNLENLLICYRAFKEVRNDFTHHGGRASQRAVEASTAYRTQTAASLNIKEAPELLTILGGSPILLSLRGVVGFSDVVIRLIATLDFLLSDSVHAEGVLKKRWLSQHQGLVTVKAAGPARDAQLIKLIKQCELPCPVNPIELFNYLNSQRLVA